MDSGADSAPAPNPESAAASEQALRPVMVVTLLGILLFTVLTFTPVGQLIGLTALPLSYFGFLVGIVLLYLLVVTWAKSWYRKKYHGLR